MKTQKFPVALAAMLVIAVGGAVALNLKPVDAPAEAIHEETPGVTGAPRESGTAKELASLAREQAHGKKERTAPEGDESNSKEPAILMPDIPDYKPVPNPTSTPGQWYEDQSMHNH